MMDVVPRLSFSLPGKEAAAHFHDQESQSRNCEARLEYLSLSFSSSHEPPPIIMGRSAAGDSGVR